MISQLMSKIRRLLAWPIRTRRNVMRRFGSLQIRVKLIIIIGILFVGLTSILSFILVQNGKRIFNDRLAETCTLSLRHISQAIKDELLLYYRSESDANASSIHIAHIRETILSVAAENIEGLSYAAVIDRNGIIIAHTDLERISHRLSLADSLYYAQVNETIVRETGGIIEYIRPVFARRESDPNSRVRLGSSVLGFSKAIILRPIRTATGTIVAATGIIILLAVVIIFVIARRMTAQIDALAEGVRQVGQGNLNMEIPILVDDELGHLAGEFNSMIVHLREKLQMQKFVSKLTVQMIRKRSGSAELQPVGERREVTLLFSDVRSFSMMTEQLGPEEVVKLINIYLDIQSRIIEENNGIVDKFMGDQVMAIFIGETQADDALHAAVEIQRSIRELNKRRKRKGEVVLTIGCGLNIGPAVMGNMGSQSRLDYTVIGDVVNLSARLCALAKPGQIIAPIEMVDRLNGEYPTIRLNPVLVKGRSQPVDIFEVDYDRAIIM